MTLLAFLRYNEDFKVSITNKRNDKDDIESKDGSEDEGVEGPQTSSVKMVTLNFKLGQFNFIQTSNVNLFVF